MSRRDSCGAEVHKHNFSLVRNEKNEKVDLNLRFVGPTTPSPTIIGGAPPGLDVSSSE
jgi:hypothetical protein